MTNRYKLVIAYDGTDFAGWQIQDTRKTVAGLLEDTFETVFTKKIHLVAASRTDAGVHALGQVAAFSTDLKLAPAQLRQAWLNRLPLSVSIRSIEKVAHEYNPRHNVEQKTYYYHIFAQRPLPLVARYGYYYYKPFCVQRLQEALNMFIGTHDFRSFCSGDDMKTTIRTIDSAHIEYLKRYGVYRISIKGPGFLRYMIRRIVGACLEVASHDTLSVQDIKKVLMKKDPQHQFPTAPACGLMLARIRYMVTRL